MTEYVIDDGEKLVGHGREEGRRRGRVYLHLVMCVMNGVHRLATLWIEGSDFSVIPG